MSYAGRSILRLMPWWALLSLAWGDDRLSGGAPPGYYPAEKPLAGHLATKNG